MNGLGLTNGGGLVNGTMAHRGPLRRNPFGVVTARDVRWAWSLLALFLLLMPPFYILLGSLESPGPAVAVDGRFDDWAGAAQYSETTESANPDSNLVAYALVAEDAQLSLLWEVGGTAFGDLVGVDALHALIDADDDAASGFDGGALGAEYLLEVRGGAARAEAATLLEWTGGPDRLNASGWRVLPSRATAAAAGSRLEAQLPTVGLTLAESMTILFAADDQEGHRSVSSVPVGRVAGALAVRQTPLINLVSTGRREVLRVDLVAMGGPVQVTGIVPTSFLEGMDWTPSRALPATVEPSLPLTVLVTVDAAQVPGGTLVEAAVASVAADRPHGITGSGARVYVGAAPGAPRVDGWFGEWGPANVASDFDFIEDPNVDIERYTSENTSAQGFFFVEFRGTALGGYVLPRRFVRAAPSPPAEAAPPVSHPPVRVSGEDILQVFIDADTTVGAGTPVGPLLADAKVEVRGVRGEVTVRELYLWQGGRWVLSGGAVKAKTGGSRLEGNFDLSVLGTLNEPNLLIVASDWTRSLVDSSEVSGGLRGARTRGGGGPQPDATNPPTWPPDSAWSLMGTDENEGQSDNTLDILELYMFYDTEYLYVRLRVEGSSPLLGDNSWWVYLDDTGAGDNDWLVEERPAGSGGVCTYNWSAGNDWGVGAGCDLTDSPGSGDVGSAVEDVSNCFGGSNGCIDFALERSDYTGLDVSAVKITAASHVTEDVNLNGDTSRNPSDSAGGGACDTNPPSSGADDCTPVFASIPEFSDVVFPAVLLSVAACVLHRRRR